MKIQKIGFWMVTGLLSFGMLMSAFMYLSKNPQIMDGFKTLGLPTYVIPFLGVAKLLGAIALLVPKFEKIKEWAYAGFAFTFIGATWFHLSTHTPFVGPLIALVLVVVSYVLRNKLNSQLVVG
jgi:uncharacterized membrane protein